MSLVFYFSYDFSLDIAGSVPVVDIYERTKTPQWIVEGEANLFVQLSLG